MYNYSIEPLLKKYPKIILSELQIESCRRKEPFTWKPAVLVIMNIDRQFMYPGTLAVSGSLTTEERRVDRGLRVSDLTFYETLHRLDCMGFTRIEISATNDWPVIEIDIEKLRTKTNDNSLTSVRKAYERLSANREFPYSLLSDSEMKKERELRVSTCLVCRSPGQTVEIYGRYAKPKKHERGSGKRFENSIVHFFTTCPNCGRLEEYH